MTARVQQDEAVDGGRIFAIVWGVFAVGFGGALVVLRGTISRMAREQRQARGGRNGGRRESPVLLLVLGVGFLVLGVAVLAVQLTRPF